MIMIVKTSGSQVVSSAVEEEWGNVRAGGGQEGEMGCATEVNGGVDVYRMHTEKAVRCAV